MKTTLAALSMFATLALTASANAGDQQARQFTQGFLKPFIGDFGHISSLVEQLQQTDDPRQVRRLAAELSLAEQSARKLLALSPVANFYRDASGKFVTRRVQEEMFDRLAARISEKVGFYLKYRDLGAELASDDIEQMGFAELTDGPEILPFYQELLGWDFEAFLSPSQKPAVAARLAERISYVFLPGFDETSNATTAQLVQAEFGQRVYELWVNESRDTVGSFVSTDADQLTAVQVMQAKNSMRDLFSKVLGQEVPSEEDLYRRLAGTPATRN